MWEASPGNWRSVHFDERTHVSPCTWFIISHVLTTPNLHLRPRSILSTPYNCLLTTPSQQWPLLPARWPTNFQFARDWVTFGTEPGQSQANQDGRSAWVPPSQDVTRRETSCHFPQSRSPDCFRSRLTSVSLSLSSGGQSLCLGVFAFVCHPLSQCLMLSQSWLDERTYEWWHYSQETSCAT